MGHMPLACCLRHLAEGFLTFASLRSSREKSMPFPFRKPENLTLEPDLYSSPLPLAFLEIVF
jgi:hypothetical protein